MMRSVAALVGVAVGIVIAEVMSEILGFAQSIR